MTSTGYVALFVSNADGEQYAYPLLLVDGELAVVGPSGELAAPATPGTELLLDAGFAGVVPARWSPDATPAPAGLDKARAAKDTARKARDERTRPVIDRGRPGPEPAPAPLPPVPPAHREPAPRGGR